MAKGFCKNHYRSFTKYGDPLAGLKKYQQFTSTEKLCGKCGKWFPHSLFSPNKVMASGLATNCKKCQGKVTQSSYRRRSLERVHEDRLRRRIRTINDHGLSVDEYQQILIKQGERCICGSTNPGGQWNIWHIDHDHQTGEVRGILCHGCNTAIGLCNDNPVRLRVLASYLERG